MNKLSKEKQQQLILTILVTGLVLAGLWFGIIRSQQHSLRLLDQKKATAQQKLSQIKKAIEMADQTEQELCDAKKQLDKFEEDMAAGDLYSWTITRIRTFKLGYKVDIPQFSQIDGPKDVSLLPSFPYKQVTVTVGGTATFHEFGKFVADFENQFPHMRLLNLSLEPASSLTAGEAEKLSFKMDIAALVKQAAS